MIRSIRSQSFFYIQRSEICIACELHERRALHCTEHRRDSMFEDGLKVGEAYISRQCFAGNCDGRKANIRSPWLRVTV